MRERESERTQCPHRCIISHLYQPFFVPPFLFYLRVKLWNATRQGKPFKINHATRRKYLHTPKKKENVDAFSISTSILIFARPNCTCPSIIWIRQVRLCVVCRLVKWFVWTLSTLLPISLSVEIELVSLSCDLQIVVENILSQVPQVRSVWLHNL